LESIALRAPSLFTGNIINDIKNSIHISSLLEATDAYAEEYDGSLTDTTAPIDSTTEPDIIVTGTDGTYYDSNIYDAGTDPANQPGTQGGSVRQTQGGLSWTIDITRELPPQEQLKHKSKLNIRTIRYGIQLVLQRTQSCLYDLRSGSDRGRNQ
jgi:hypothetical protein